MCLQRTKHLEIKVPTYIPTHGQVASISHPSSNLGKLEWSKALRQPKQFYRNRLQASNWTSMLNVDTLLWELCFSVLDEEKQEI